MTDKRNDGHTNETLPYSPTTPPIQRAEFKLEVEEAFGMTFCTIVGPIDQDDAKHLGLLSEEYGATTQDVQVAEAALEFLRGIRAYSQTNIKLEENSGYWLLLNPISQSFAGLAKDEFSTDSYAKDAEEPAQRFVKIPDATILMVTDTQEAAHAARDYYRCLVGSVAVTRTGSEIRQILAKFSAYRGNYEVLTLSDIQRAIATDTKEFAEWEAWREKEVKERQRGEQALAKLTVQTSDYPVIAAANAMIACILPAEFAGERERNVEVRMDQIIRFDLACLDLRDLENLADAYSTAEAMLAMSCKQSTACGYGLRKAIDAINESLNSRNSRDESDYIECLQSESGGFCEWVEEHLDAEEAQRSREEDEDEQQRVEDERQKARAYYLSGDGRSVIRKLARRLLKEKCIRFGELGV